MCKRMLETQEEVEILGDCNVPIRKVLHTRFDRVLLRTPKADHGQHTNARVAASRKPTITLARFTMFGRESTSVEPNGLSRPHGLNSRKSVVWRAHHTTLVRNISHRFSAALPRKRKLLRRTPQKHGLINFNLFALAEFDSTTGGAL